MPQGKGTYGSQVGRPPSSNARERSVREYAGGGKVGYNSIGAAKYNEGGKAKWEDIEGGAKMLRFSKDRTSGINPEVGKAAKKVADFVKKAAKKISKAAKKHKYKAQGKKIDRKTKRIETLKEKRASYEEENKEKK